MNAKSSMLLIGIGTAGARIARGVSRAYGDDLRFTIADTDASSGEGGGDFTLLGGDRLSGRGSGGDIVAARLATEDSVQSLDSRLEGVRLAVIATCLGGGTGGGATLETLRRLSSLGIPAIVFATTPFLFEGEDRQRNARGVMSMIEDAANATFFLPLDKLVSGEDNMEAAMRRAIDTVAGGITLFWRLVEKPGYIKLDADRLRHLLSSAGRGRFAIVSTQGTNRATEAVEKLVGSELLATASAPTRAILCGVLAGEDLRLSELGIVTDGIRRAFGDHASFALGTVNDEATFCGRLAVVVMVFESKSSDADDQDEPTAPGGRRRKRGAKGGGLGIGPSGRGRFNNAEPTIWHGEDLDVPTFIRHGINLDF